MYAYIFAEFTRMGIAKPIPKVDWNDGSPNPRFRILQLLHDNFGPGDEVVNVATGAESGFSPYVYSFAAVTKGGKRRVLLVNKRDRMMKVTIPGASGGEQAYVDQKTGGEPPAIAKLSTDEVVLNGYAVAAVTLP